MTVSFDVYRIGRGGERVLVHSTQSAREAREVRDASPGEMVVIGPSGRMDDQQLDEFMTVHEIQQVS